MWPANELPCIKKLSCKYKVQTLRAGPWVTVSLISSPPIVFVSYAGIHPTLWTLQAPFYPKNLTWAVPFFPGPFFHQIHRACSFTSAVSAQTLLLSKTIPLSHPKSPSLLNSALLLPMEVMTPQNHVMCLFAYLSLVSLPVGFRPDSRNLVLFPTTSLATTVFSQREHVTFVIIYEVRLGIFWKTGIYCFWYLDPENINLPYGQSQDKLMSTTRLLLHVIRAVIRALENGENMIRSSSMEYLRYCKTNITYYCI